MFDETINWGTHVCFLTDGVEEAGGTFSDLTVGAWGGDTAVPSAFPQFPTDRGSHNNKLLINK